jgi:hypothetical protein
MAIEFSINKGTLSHSVKPFFVGRGRSGALSTVRVEARKGQVEFQSADLSATAEAVVTSPGCAQIPFKLFENYFRRPGRLAWSPAEGMTIRIAEGEIDVGGTVFNHPGISIRSAEALKVSLPPSATLQETLLLSLQYSEGELKDAGLLKRVEAAKDQAAKMVDKAAKALAPLNITRESLIEFMWHQMKKPAERLKL